MQLNPQQLQAVNHFTGPCVVFAGAGAGKTMVMVQRIARLITHHKINPRSICALTFTNKAANEMKHRAISLVPSAQLSTISTFHSAAVRWLREFGDNLGYDNNFSILDGKDSEALVKKIIKKMKQSYLKQGGIERDFERPALYCNEIKKLKIRYLLFDAEQTKKFCDQYALADTFEIYRSYQRTLKANNSMDFADLLLNTIELLENYQGVRKLLSDRYKFFLVDEYQDVNLLQFKIITYLTRTKQNLMVVGDDDQSIYSWRGADPSNILNFSQAFNNAKEFRLELNYRSSGNIIDAANSVISNNTIRAEKKLTTGADQGKLITIYRAYDSKQQAKYVCEEILRDVSLQEKNQEKTSDLRDYAVFYRTNAQSREIEDHLMYFHIPYKIYGSLRFYDRMEIKDLLSYFRLAINNKDDSAFLRVIKAPNSGIGEKSLEILADFASRNQKSLFQAMELISSCSDAKYVIKDSKLKDPLIAKFKKTYHIFNNFFQVLLSDNPANAVRHFIDHINYQEYLKKSYPDNYNDKLANIQELGVGLTSYFENHPNCDLAQWLHNVSLAGSEKESVQGVSLMTLHAAKGLEFNRVFIIGCDEGKLPHSNSTDSLELLEEERRLFYVGMTRAKKQLSMTTVAISSSFHGNELAKPSRFFKEIPENKVKFIGDFSTYNNYSMQNTIKNKIKNTIHD